MSYKLIAIDLDGTLLKSDRTISKRNISAINKANERGVKVVIATGRPLIGIMDYLKKIGARDEDYVISYNGAMVKRIKNNETVHMMPLKKSDYEYLYDYSSKYGVHIHALTETYVTTPVMNSYTKIESELNDIEIKVECVSGINQDEILVKIMMIDDPEKLDQVVANLPEEVTNKYTVVRSSEIFLEFLDRSVNKGTGVKIIADKLGIKSEEIICIGDAGNDVAMIKYAGLGVAMGNAFSELKEISDYITDSNEEDGVAKVIEKFILNA